MRSSTLFLLLASALSLVPVTLSVKDSRLAQLARLPGLSRHRRRRLRIRLRLAARPRLWRARLRLASRVVVIVAIH